MQPPTLSGIVAGTAVAPAAPAAPGAPAATLAPGTLDAPAATSVQEAQRSAGLAAEMAGGGHAGHGGHGGHGAATYRHVDVGRGPDAHRAPGDAGGHEGHGSAAPAGEASDPEAAAYVCPMHPEIRSEEPGTCPICGMALERRGG